MRHTIYSNYPSHWGICMTGVAAALSPDSISTPRTLLIGQAVEQPAVHRLLFDNAIPLITLTGPEGSARHALPSRLRGMRSPALPTERLSFP